MVFFRTHNSRLLLLVEPQKMKLMKLTMIAVSIFVMIFEQNVIETESDWTFKKNVTTCLQNKKVYLKPPSSMSTFIWFKLCP